MLVEDTTAFIEQVEVQEADRRASKRRRRLAQAELDVMRAEFDAGLADGALRRLAADLAVARELADARGERVIAREIAVVRGRQRAAREDLVESRERLRSLQRQAADNVPRRVARMFRLHSAHHHVECSERRFARLATSQFERPVLVAKREGRYWWWFLDRFWWDDEGLSPREVAAHVLGSDLQRQRDAVELAGRRARLTGETPRQPTREEPVSPVVRFAVWCRDRGRCVDCSSADDLAYEAIIPQSKGGLRWIANVELRCAGCRERRALNTARTRVGRARVESTAYGR